MLSHCSFHQGTLERLGRPELRGMLCSAAVIIVWTKLVRSWSQFKSGEGGSIRVLAVKSGHDAALVLKRGVVDRSSGELVVMIIGQCPSRKKSSVYHWRSGNMSGDEKLRSMEDKVWVLESRCVGWSVFKRQRVLLLMSDSSIRPRGSVVALPHIGCLALKSPIKRKGFGNCWMRLLSCW